MRSVLIVEDDLRFLQALCQYLRKLPGEFEVFPALSGRDALELLAMRSFDVLLTDIYLPDGDGLEIARRARAHDAGLDLVVMTGHDSPEARSRATDAGAAAFLDKPVDMEQLKELLMRCGRGNGHDAGMGPGEQRGARL